MIVHTMPQRTPEWHAQRAKCLLTASDAGQFLLKNDQRSKDARLRRIFNYLCRDCYTGGDTMLIELAEKERKALDYNLAVQRGNILESAAIATLEEVIGQKVHPVGLITTADGLFGASTDGLIGKKAIAEAKVPLPETHLSYIIEHQQTGQMIDDYLLQVHMGLAISERDTCHFLSLSMPFTNSAGETVQHPHLHIEVKRDKFTDQVGAGLAALRDQLESVKLTLSAVHRAQRGKAVA